MSIDDIAKHSNTELNTHVIDKALFGDAGKYIAVISWRDMARYGLKRGYDGIMEFLSYLAPDLATKDITRCEPLFTPSQMKHPYDNAFRVEFRKPTMRYMVGMPYQPQY